MKHHVISEEEWQQFQALKRIWQDIHYEKSGQFFICGSSQDRDENGLPEYIVVCPTDGLDDSFVYKRDKQVVTKLG